MIRKKTASPPANDKANPSKTSASAPSHSPDTGVTVIDRNPDLVNPTEGTREVLTSPVPSDGKNDKADSKSTEEQSKGGEDNLEKASSVLEESLDVEEITITDGEVNGIQEIRKETEGNSLEEPSAPPTNLEKVDINKTSGSTDNTPVNPRVDKIVSETNNDKQDEDTDTDDDLLTVSQKANSLTPLRKNICSANKLLGTLY